MSNNADTTKLIDMRVNGDLTVPNVVLETAGGNRISLPYTWEELDKMDNIIKEQCKNEKSND